MKSEVSFKRFLDKMVADESLREAFLEQSSIFRDRDGDFARRILGSAQEDVRALGKELLVRAIDLNSRFNNHRSSFLQGLWNSLKDSNAGLVTDVVTSLAKRDDARLMLWHASPLFSEVLRVEDVQPFAAAMSAVGCSQIAYSTMLAIRHSKRKDARDVYEAGRPFLAEEYARQETSQVESDNSERERKLQILRDFRAMLEPEPGHYMQGVFEFYNGNWADLDPVMSVDDRGRLVHLITDTALVHMDPATSKLTRSSEEESTAYTTSIAVESFREALMAARHLGLDIESFRRQILNYIPFAYHDELEAILSLLREIRPGELVPVIDIYAFRSSDLWRHNPASFIRAMEQYHAVDAVPVLRELAFEPGWHPYEREQAMVAATSLAPPDSAFLKRSSVAIAAAKSRMNGGLQRQRMATAHDTGSS